MNNRIEIISPKYVRQRTDSPLAKILSEYTNYEKEKLLFIERWAGVFLPLTPKGERADFFLRDEIAYF